eukprot:m.69469 g.69469  ORF g.69469 m.69469 type:complete len:1254 (+) comp13989_c0_seq2:242-4003(+)
MSETDITTAITNVQHLRTHNLTDDQPCIEASAVSLNYDVSFDSNFEDRGAFIMGISKYVEEAQWLATLNSILEDGFKFSGTIYTWRSCSRAIPAVKSNEQPNRAEIYQKTVEVLGPEVEKLKQFYHFQNSAIDRFVAEIKKLAHPEKLKGFISQATKVTLGKLINMFAVLDALKNMKACLNNDFSFYKRAFGFLNKGNADPASVTEEREIAFFLATQDSITTKLLSSLEQIEHFDEVLAEIANECATLFEQGLYVLPSEKHMLLKIIAFSLYLMDGTTGKTTIYKNKRLNIQRFDTLFKQLPIVPLFGDMQISLMSFVQKSKNFDETKWTAHREANDARIGDVRYNIVDKMPAFKQQRDAFMAELSLVTAKTFEGVQTNMSGSSPSDLALRGVRLVSDWTATVQELYAWKLAHPTDKYMNRECTDDAEAYERATRYNYSKTEKVALVELIAMIKELARMMYRLDGLLNGAIRRQMHEDVQKFVQHTLRDVIRSVTKKKKTQVKTVLMAIRNTCADWAAGVEPKDDPAMKGDKDPKFMAPDVKQRQCGPGSTQLYMLRTMVESLCRDDKKKALRADIGDKHLPPLDSFYSHTFWFPYLLDFNQTLQESVDLSQLWYREFFLELSMGQRIQFPIDMSLPWILIDHILTTKNASMMEYVLFPLDLYNDSANFALKKFCKQFLYDEVEAEVDLCFDQLIFKLSELVFSHYKSAASSMMLDKTLRKEAAAQGVRVPYAAPARFEALFQQRHVQLLGRSVDLNRLLGQRLNISLKKSIDLAIHRFESKTLSTILELDALLETTRLARDMLSEHFTLDPFDEMVKEVNDSVTSMFGRITLHVFAEISTDVIPNFIFSTAAQRFARPEKAPEFQKQPDREREPRAAPHFFFGSKALNSAFAAIQQQHINFVGVEHFKCVARWVGYGGVAMCIDELLKTIRYALKNVLTPYVTSLLEGMPKLAKLPLFDYGSSGAVGFYQLRLKDVLAYRDLQTEVFHAFREVGNAIICFTMLEQAMTLQEMTDLRHLSPFQGMIPAVVREGEKPEDKLREAQQKYGFMRFSSVSSKFGGEEMKKVAQQAETLTRERISTDKKGLSIFQCALGKIKGYLKEADADSGNIWSGPPPANGVVDIDECNQFYRLWSAIQITALYTAASKGRDFADEYFGDGLYWAGLTLVYLLGQRQRFEALDFTYHILKVHELDKKEEVLNGVDLTHFVQFGRQKRALNTHVFSLLDKYLLDEARTVDKPQYVPPPSDIFEATV